MLSRNQQPIKSLRSNERKIHLRATMIQGIFAKSQNYKMPNVQVVLILVGRVQASPSDIEVVMFRSLGYGTGDDQWIEFKPKREVIEYCCVKYNFLFWNRIEYLINIFVPIGDTFISVYQKSPIFARAKSPSILPSGAQIR